jgi:transcriptional regulator with XRE-family HTH domain
MERNILEDLFKLCGSVTQAAKELGLTREQLSDIRNGRSEIPFNVAAEIANYMNLHTNIKVHFLDLIPHHKKNKLKRVPLDCYLPFKLRKMFLNDVKHPTKTDWISEELRDLDKARPIIVDENNQLIANPITYFLHIQNCKVKILAWKISLSDLAQGKYEVSDLISIFDQIERGSIGIALGNFIGKRQGQRTDLFRNKKQCAEYEHRLKLDEVTGRTDQRIADLLGLTRTQYRQLKKIILHGSDELIEKVRAKQITISAAASYVYE